MCVLFFVLRDFFRIFGDSVLEWLYDLFTKVKYAAYFYGIYMFSFVRAFSLSMQFATAPRVSLSQACFGRYVCLVFYIIYVFIKSLS